MRVALLSHPSALEHDAGWGHPERPDRIPAVVTGVRESALTVLEVVPDPVERETLELVHDPGYIDRLERFCAAGGGALDADTHAGAGSWEAALRAAGAGRSATDVLAAEAADVAFIAMRPPGHHALAARAMGFCLFNNIALEARRLNAAGARVAIIDWDVHHGNGTQELFHADPGVLYVSWHEYPAYPGTGRVEDVGSGPGTGMTLNIPWPPGTGGAPYRWTMAHVVVPVLGRFEPDWVLVSAGYDAHTADPLATIRLVAADYRHLAAALAATTPPGRLVFFLEGGYDLEALRTSVTATLGGVTSGQAADGDTDVEPPGGAAVGIARDIAAVAAEYWDVPVPDEVG